MKVVYFAFANDPRNPLESLTKEARLIREVLTKKNVSADFALTIDEFATPESVNRFMDEFGDNLAVFQFSGHAGAEVLQTSLGNLFANGLAGRLKRSSDKSILKLVVLNGCSTWGQVKDLINNGVPAVVSTSCPVKDQAALNFSTTFWRQLADFDRTLGDSFDDALNAAKSVSGTVPDSASRHIVTTDTEMPGDEEPSWGLHVKAESSLKSYPLPRFTVQEPVPPGLPNIVLTKTLFDSFKKAGNDRMRDDAELYEQQNAIINSFPLPIGTHLQKLVCPTAESEEGYNSFNIKRLTQISEFFHITTEFFAIVMIAQVWDLYLNYKDEFEVSEAAYNVMREYLYMDAEERKTYNYVSVVSVLRRCIEDQSSNNPKFKSFIDEQDMTRNIFQNDPKFRDACSYLFYLRKLTVEKKVDEERVKHISLEAEKQLCEFVRNLGFIHRYQLTSVQSIDVWKFRHIRRENTEYRHKVVRCMEVIGQKEQKYYYLNMFLDNRGMDLLKCEINVIDGNRNNFRGKVIDYLNLAPFVIDKNSYDDKTTLAWVMFFNGMDDRYACFKSIRKPEERSEYWEIPFSSEPGSGLYDLNTSDPITAQLMEFRDFVDNKVSV